MAHNLAHASEVLTSKRQFAFPVPARTVLKARRRAKSSHADGSLEFGGSEVGARRKDGRQTFELGRANVELLQDRPVRFESFSPNRLEHLFNAVLHGPSMPGGIADEDLVG